MYKLNFHLSLILTLLFASFLGCKKINPASEKVAFHYQWTTVYFDENKQIIPQEALSSGTITGCVASPELPKGLVLDQSNCSLKGTPQSFNALSKYTITSSSGESTYINIQVSKAAPKITYGSLNSFTFNINSTVNLLATNTGGNITSCSVTPNLPTGLVIDSNTCHITGMPTTKFSQSEFKVISYNDTMSSSKIIYLTILAKPEITFPQASITTEVNEPFSTQTVLNSGSPIDSCQISPALPTGLIFNTKTCAITGTPTVNTRAIDYLITATNQAGNGTTTLNIFVATYSGLKPAQLALLINDADPYSVSIGEYYRVNRKIPNANILHLNFPVKVSLTRNEFAPIKTFIDANLTAGIQAIAIAWTLPSRVECNSMTNAISRGFMSGPCDATGVYPTCGFADYNQYYNSNYLAPFSELNFRPSMMLAALNQADARTMINNGIASDNTSPTGSAYVMKTSDNTRSLRANILPVQSLGTSIAPYVDVKKITAEKISYTNDALFYFQGLVTVADINTNVFPPGAIADNLTSFGGMLTDSSQMSILNFVAGGVTGTFGTVSEPCAYDSKFPDPSILIKHYTSGNTLIEAYWKSISQTFQGEFVGEPLANPWRKPLPIVDGICGSVNNTVISSPPFMNLCLSGTANPVTDNFFNYTWNCSGIRGGISKNCSATIKIDGVCGAANNTSTSITPLFNLCSSGAYTSPTISGSKYVWACIGRGAFAITANCSANKL